MEEMMKSYEVDEQNVTTEEAPVATQPTDNYYVSRSTAGDIGKIAGGALLGAAIVKGLPWAKKKLAAAKEKHEAKKLAKAQAVLAKTTPTGNTNPNGKEA